jgi:subtilisin family serine protease
VRKQLTVMVAAATTVLLVAVAAAARTTAPASSGVLAPDVEATLAALGPAEMTTVIVTLRDHADLGRVPGANRRERMRAVERALRTHADTSQSGLRSFVRLRTGQGKVARSTDFWIVNGSSVTATADVIREIAQRPDVASVTSDVVPVVPTAGPAEPSVAAIGAPALWDLGTTGQGVVVASLDTGVDVTHPDLAARWRGGTNSWFDPYGQHPGSPVDLAGHGTGVMGIIVGGDAGGTSIGVAPGAQWIAARIFNDKGAATATAIHSAFQWILDPDGNPATGDAPNVVNNSWAYGTGPSCNLAFQPDVQALRSAGIVSVFAAGNFGPGASSSVSPANYPEALSVGAVDNSGAISSLSSRGPASCGGTSPVFPKLVAPGVGVTTADRLGAYQSLTGTSVSAPQATGALALLLSAYPGLGVSQQESALELGAVDLGTAGPDPIFGYGRLDLPGAFAAVNPADFVVSAAPSSLASTVGSAITSTVAISPVSGFAGDVSLSVSGLPTGATASFAPPVVTGGGGASVLTISTTSTTTAGTYALGITGSSGAITHTSAISLVVSPPPDFALSATPSTLTAVAGTTATLAATVSPLNGFTGDVSLSVGGLTPTVSTVTMTPAVVAGGSGTSQIAIATLSTATPGSYSLTVTATAGTLVHTALATLVVTQAPDFTLTVTPGSISLRRGGQATTSVAVAAVAGFSSSVALSVSGLPSGVTAVFAPTAVVPGGKSTLTLKASKQARTGAVTVTITGIGGGKTRTRTVSLALS